VHADASPPRPHNASQTANQQSQNSLSTMNMIHLRLIQTHNQKNGHQKRENINQVIKDCLTTKKFGPQSQETKKGAPKKRKERVKMGKESPQKHIQILQHPQTAQPASQHVRRQKLQQIQKTKEQGNEKTAVVLARQLADIDPEFGYQLALLVQEQQQQQ
jgi:hypothetical protein